MRMAFLTSSIGLCAIPFCAWAGVSLYQGGAAEQAVTPFAVERTNKTDRMVGAFNVHGEFLPAIDRRALHPTSQVTSGAGLSQRYPAVSCSWSATTRTGVGTVHTFSQLGLRILDRDDVPPCDVLARARWPGSSDPT
jgi:hypothetical protein